MITPKKMAWIGVVGLLLVTSCTPINQKLFDSLNQSVDVLTYDQALSKWGPPGSEWMC